MTLDRVVETQFFLFKDSFLGSKIVTVSSNVWEIVLLFDELCLIRDPLFLNLCDLFFFLVDLFLNVILFGF
jgi:hypothetical protein